MSHKTDKEDARFVDYEPASSDDDAASVVVQPATDFKPEPVTWLWPQWLARGKLHLLAGAAGTGKTTIAMSLAAIVSRGGCWPSGEPAEVGDVLVWSGEDDIADTLLPRLLAAGGDPRRVHFITGARERGRSRSFDPATDLPKLMEAARRLPNLSLLILDSVVSVVTGDSHKNTETRRGLQPVVDLAATLRCAVLGLTHLTKNTSGREPLDRVTGSLAFGAVARGVLATVKPADPKAPRRLVRAKSNVGPDCGGFAYRLYAALLPELDFSAQAVEWGEELQGSARELMAVEQHDGMERSQEAAITFLKDFLAKGPVATKEVKAAAEAHGHRWRTVERVKRLLGVIAIKSGQEGRWAWQLPPAKTDSSNQDRQQE